MMLMLLGQKWTHKEFDILLEELKKFRDPYNDFKKVINKNIEYELKKE